MQSIKRKKNRPRPLSTESSITFCKPYDIGLLYPFRSAGHQIRFVLEINAALARRLFFVISFVSTSNYPADLGNIWKDDSMTGILKSAYGPVYGVSAY